MENLERLPDAKDLFHRRGDQFVGGSVGDESFKAGDRFCQPDLAGTLETISQKPLAAPFPS